MKRVSILAIACLLALSGLLAFFHLASHAAGIPVEERPAQEPPPGGATEGRLHPALLRLLESAAEDEYLPIIVEWRPSGAGLESLAIPESGLNRLERRAMVVSALQQRTQNQAAGLLSRLQLAAHQGQARRVNAFWVSPVVALEATPGLVRALAQRPDVAQVRPDERITLSEPELEQENAAASTPAYPFNLDMIEVDLAEAAFGLDGSGVVVANLDTGVDWQHPALLSKYRGYNPKGPSVHAGNWHVSTNEPYQVPGDGNGHGTHTMGSMVGDDGASNRIGVAPGARWIAVKLFTNYGYTYESWVHDAFQWIMAPEGDPSLAPDVVNNSWGSAAGSDPRYLGDVAALRAAGILPVFSAGNNGPDPNTVASPGSYPQSLAVGAVDQLETVAYFSSRGPSPFGEIKPEVVAPGVDVRSAYPGGGYALGDGTSMAAPHLAGLAALLLQADSSLTPDQLEAAILSTAKPLGPVVPNNDSGWGLVNAYAAAMHVSQSGELVGSVLKSIGVVPYPAISVAPHDAGGYTQTVSLTGDAYGNFALALAPGRYDVTASAFGYLPQSLYNVEVITAAQTRITFTLSLAAIGSVFGQISDALSGAPLSATLSVEDTPARTQTDPATGAYSLALPEGVWSLRVEADAHRIGHLTSTVVAGSGVQLDLALEPAPRILLVDSGPWYYNSQVSYFQDALDALDYTYTLWPLRDPFGMQAASDLPTTTTLAAYDLVIWSAPEDSPGLVNAGEVLSYYLSTGGDLLVSGQDVAYWDGGGSIYGSSQDYLTRQSGVWFSEEGNLSDLHGAPSSPLHDLTVALNTPDSAAQQVTPDSAVLLDPVLTHPALVWDDGAVGGALAGSCQPYRSAWLGFGLEGAGPRPARLELLQRLQDWFSSANPQRGLVASQAAQTLIAPAGELVSTTLSIQNVGDLSDTLLIQAYSSWPIELELPDGRRFSDHIELELASCATAGLTATISIPAGSPRAAANQAHVLFSSLNDPHVSATLALKARTPAPLLLVDDERWYDNMGRYTAALDLLGLPYDLVATNSGSGAPPTQTMRRAPLMLWTTGYDWFLPLSLDDERMLEAYLDGGGRLLLASQDLLDVRGVDEFARNRLGVLSARLTVTPTQAYPVPGNPAGIEPELWGLIYPFHNWGDALHPDPLAHGLLVDENLNHTGLLRPDADWRSAFFSFPLEALDYFAMETLLGRTLLWISPFGESRLEAPPAILAGEPFPITLTLGLATTEPMTQAQAVLPLLPETSLVSGSLSGGWSFDPGARSLVWQGDLTPGVSLTLSAELEMDSGLPQGARLPLRARLYDSNGILAVAEAGPHIGVPWLRLEKRADPLQTAVTGTVQVELQVSNAGVLATSAILTESLPAGLNIISGTLSASLGNLTPVLGGFTWQEELPPGGVAWISYQAQVDLPRPGARLTARSHLTYPEGERLAWAHIDVPAYIYLPIFFQE